MRRVTELLGWHDSVGVCRAAHSLTPIGMVGGGRGSAPWRWPMVAALRWPLVPVAWTPRVLIVVTWYHKYTVNNPANRVIMSQQYFKPNFMHSTSILIEIIIKLTAPRTTFHSPEGLSITSILTNDQFTRSEFLGVSPSLFYFVRKTDSTRLKNLALCNQVIRFRTYCDSSDFNYYF